MILKNTVIGSAFAVLGVTHANAADAIVAPEPEAVEYVRVCDAYGAGYFYIPGTETCLRIHGYVRYDLRGGDNVYYRGAGISRAPDGSAYNLSPRGKSYDTWTNNTRFTLRTSTASETELGTLSTFTETRFNFGNGVDAGTTLNRAFIQLGGLRVGLDDTAFYTFTGYFGDVLNDDVISAGGYRTNQISYTFKGGNGFSAIISLEQGNNVDVDWNGVIDDYTPHVVAGLKYEQSWGSIAGVAAYDAVNEEWAGKVRVDVNVTDRFSVWVQGAYKSNDDHYVHYDASGAVVHDGGSSTYRGVRVIDSFYGTWGGDWAVWGGAKFKATNKAVFNVQLAYEDAETFAASANVAYQLVPGFTITPQISYTKWDDKNSILKGQDAWQGVVRFQRSF